METYPANADPNVVRMRRRMIEDIIGMTETLRYDMYVGFIGRISMARCHSCNLVNIFGILGREYNRYILRDYFICGMCAAKFRINEWLPYLVHEYFINRYLIHDLIREGIKLKPTTLRKGLQSLFNLCMCKYTKAQQLYIEEHILPIYG
jgi:hypothetical protein